MNLEKITPREHEVAALICTGSSTKTAAQRLGISRNTIKDHMSAVYMKTGLPNRAALAVALVKAGKL